MWIDPQKEALRLLEQVDPADLAELADDPALAVEVLLGVKVTVRPPDPRGAGCPVDGTYRSQPSPHIRVANDVLLTRQRFTILHELGHHFIEHDDRLNDLEVDDAARRDEDICNEIAAAVLLPAEVVSEILPRETFEARDVVALFAATRASRMAACVAAARRLRSHGCVILGTPDGTAVFTAHNPSTPWRIARGTPQGADSLLVKAARRSTRHARDVTRVRFASGNSSGAVHGDAFVADDDWGYEVIVADTHSPWQRGFRVGLTDTGPEFEDIECGRCDEVRRVWTAPCRTCGDRRCPGCGYCSCPVGPARVVCRSCTELRPPNQFTNGSDVCIDCAQTGVQPATA